MDRTASALVLVASLLVAATVDVAGREYLEQPVASAASAVTPVESIDDAATTPSTATCTDQIGPSLPPPDGVKTGLPGFHAAWYGQSGYPTLCAGSTSTATIAFMNTGSDGWYTGIKGATAYLGTSNPEPGIDKASPLGGTETGWPSAARVAVQPAPYVGPGQVAWFQFAVKAPSTPGVYRLAIRPVIEGTRWLEDFGVFWYVTVKESDAIVTPAPITAPVSATEPPPRTYFPASVAGVRTIRVPSLMYHYVEWLPPAADALRMDLTVSPRDFEDQLRLLRSQGYTSISTKDLWWTLDQGGALPARPIQLTFDDGYADAATVVAPTLKRFGFTGTFFITVNLVGKPGYMTKEQVRQLVDMGMDVEAHAMDHYPMNQLSPDMQRYQMCTARKFLNEWTGTDVRFFAYPSGDYNDQSFAALRDCGYLAAFKKAGGAVQTSSNMFTLQRSRVRGQQGLNALLLALTQ